MIIIIDWLDRHAAKMYALAGLGAIWALAVWAYIGSQGGLLELPPVRLLQLSTGSSLILILILSPAAYIVYRSGKVQGVDWLGIIRREAGWPTADEMRIAELRYHHEKEERARLADIKAVAKELRPQIISTLTSAGFTYIYERQGAAAKASKPRIKTILYTKDAIYYRIDKLPFRSTFVELLKPEVAHNLSLAIGRECRFIEHTDIGVWIQVGLKSGLAAIPKYFAWKADDNPANAMELLPSTKKWTVAMGMTENRRFVYEDVRDWPHLLVAGATGGGKSVFMNQMLCTLLQRLSPSQLEIVLIDLKGGLEFWPYHNIPHLRRDVVVEKDDVPGALAEIVSEKKRRFALLRKAGVKDIKGWNATKPNKLPYVFILFDEIANLMLNTKLKRAVEKLIEDLAAQGRALGLHMILCTQVPQKDVLSTLIRGNIPNRVVFNTDAVGSQIALGNGRAAELPPGGRMVYKRSSKYMECQAPFITEKQVEEVIEQLTDEPAGADGDEVTHNDLFRAAIYNYAGWFTYRDIYDGFSGQASQLFIKETAAAWEFDYQEQGPVIDLDGGRYVMGRCKKRGGRGRRLAAVNGHLPQNDDEMDALFESELTTNQENNEASSDITESELASVDGQMGELVLSGKESE